MTSGRMPEIMLGGARLAMPVFFPSISSVKTALSPVEYLSMLHSLREMNQQFLVSAFDLCQADDGEGLLQLLTSAQESGAMVLMDSGNYESYWKDKQASWLQPEFHNALQRFPYTLAFSFDEQYPPVDQDAHIDLVVDRWRQDQAVAGDRVIVPIVHENMENLPNLCARVANETKTPIIAVAERRLGYGVFERARTVMALREALDQTGRYVALHLLGTGNPISIAIYTWAGADSFDGLEWCQTVVDHETGLLFHYAQSDFFRQQTMWGDDEISFHARTLAHNLTFYTDWMQRLREAIHSGETLRFCRFNFPPRVFSQCVEEFGWTAS